MTKYISPAIIKILEDHEPEIDRYDPMIVGCSCVDTYMTPKEWAQHLGEIIEEYTQEII